MDERLRFYLRRWHLDWGFRALPGGRFSMWGEEHERVSGGRITTAFYKDQLVFLKYSMTEERSRREHSKEPYLEVLIPVREP